MNYNQGHIFGIDIQKESRSDIAGLKFDEIIPYRIQTGTRIRESDIIAIQNRILGEALALDENLEQITAYSETKELEAEELKRVKETYFDGDMIENPYDAKLYADGRSYEDVLNEAESERENAKIQYQESRQELFRRVCDLSYTSNDSLPDEVRGKESMGGLKTWSFVTLSTQTSLGPEYEEYAQSVLAQRAHAIAEQRKTMNHERESMKKAELNARVEELSNTIQYASESVEKQSENPSF